MTINRDNYETYFLLYLDKELPGEEMHEVESFIASHPDLEEEFKKLQEVVLQPEEQISFDRKTQILRFDGSSMEEKMLLLLDGELEGPESDQLHQQVENSALLTAEWEILKSTRLDKDETIDFKDKSILYRREKAKVIPGRFIKWAVAAALLGAGFFFSIQLAKLRDTTTQGSVVSNQPGRITAPAMSKVDTMITNTEKTEHKSAGQDIAVKRADKIPVESSPVVPSPKKTNKADHLLANVSPSANTLPVEDNKLLADHKTYQAIEKDDQIVAQKLITVKPKQPIEITDVNILDLPKNSLAATAGFTNEQNENHILFMREDAVTHSKAGGLFRRIKRTVERKTKINTGNSLKIAGFEIAIN